MKKIFSKKIIFILLAALTFIFVLTPSIIKAADYYGPAFGPNFELTTQDTSSGALKTIFGAIMGYIFFPLISLGITVAVWLLELAMNINLGVIDSPMVQIGWKILLQVANLGFVLVIIIIAFATIFRQESYAMKNTLWKLIVAALLVNFSLVIAGAFISISDLLSTIMLNKIAGTNTATASGAILSGPAVVGNVGMALMQFFKGQMLGQVNQYFLSTGAGSSAEAFVNALGTGFLAVVLGSTFVSLFGFLIFLTFLAMTIMLLIRYVMLGIILLASPLAWLAWILPATKKHWDDWWDKFLRWTFFFPIMLFFLWLAIATINGVGTTQKGLDLSGRADPDIKRIVDPQLTFGIDLIGQMAIAIALALAGLFVANKLSITGAKEALKLGTTAAKVAGKTGGMKLGRAFGIGRGLEKLQKNFESKGGWRRAVSARLLKPTHEAYQKAEKKYGAAEAGVLGSILRGGGIRGGVAAYYRESFGLAGKMFEEGAKAAKLTEKESRTNKDKRLRKRYAELENDYGRNDTILNKQVALNKLAQEKGEKEKRQTELKTKHEEYQRTGIIGAGLSPEEKSELEKIDQDLKSIDENIKKTKEHPDLSEEGRKKMEARQKQIRVEQGEVNLDLRQNQEEAWEAAEKAEEKEEGEKGEAKKEEKK